MPSIKQALARRGAVAVAAAAGAGAKRRMLNQAPPNKRRRVMLHESSTATEDDEDDDVESSEHDNALDADYRDEEENNDNERNAPRRRARKSSSSRHSRSYSSASSASASSSSSAASSSLSESSYASPKPLSPIEVNSARTSRSASRHRRSSTTKKHRAQAARKLQKGIPVKATAPRYTISPVKLLPSAPSQALKRGFHVRPDPQIQPYFGRPSDFAMARHQRSAPIVPSPSKNPFRKMAGKFVRAVNNMGISGNARQSGAIPTARQQQQQNQDIYAGPTHPSQVSSRAESFNSSTKRKRESARRSSSSTRPVQVEVRAKPEELAAIPPLRRTRSIARKMEEIGAPISGIDSRPSTERQRGQSVAEEEEDDDETASVERSIAEMSLDEISEHKEDEDEEDDESVADEDDSWCMNEATSPQLHRLRKDKLLRLATLLPNEAESDHSDYTKDGLVKLILDARLDFKPNESTNPSSSSSSGCEDEGRTRTNSAADLPTAAQAYATRHTRRSSAASDVASTSGPSSSHSTPRRSRRSGLRSKSYPHAVESSAGENEDDEDDVPLAVRRRRTINHGGHARAVSLNLAKDSSMAERTPGRLRSGKLRASASLSEMPSSSHEEDNEGDGDEEKEENLPTPIARRTRHRRNLSSVSVSSAGLGDDEKGDLRNREYRLTKVSLPRRAKKGSLIEVSDSESLDEEDQEEEDIEEAGEETIEAIAKEDLPSDEEEDGENEDDFNHEEGFDSSSATLSSLMKLKRDDLARLCRDRDIAEEGTKKDLSNALLEWYSAKQSDNAEGDASSPASSDNEEDEDFVPQADTSMASVSSVEEEEEEGEEEPDYRNAVSSPARSDATARASTKRARNETKTQALAKLSNKRQSYDAESQEKPLLLHSQDDLVHSRKVDTPPGSGDQQANDLELDLESLNLLDKEIAADKLKKGEKIGSGGFKDVYEGKYRNVKVALADIRGHLTENDIKELGLLRDLRHENIVRFIGVSIPEQKDVPVTIVTELCSNGDLFDYIRNVSPPAFDKILSIMLNVAKGVDYLHNRKPAIIHRDLKSSNVLITARGVAKIADFGLARVRNSTRSMIKSLVGTVNWQAPELWVAHPRYNEKADVYSAGLVFWECLQWHLSQKRYPFEGMNEHAIYQEVGQRQMRPATATMRRQWGGDILDLVERMWAQDPKERPHMSEVVKDLERLLQTEKARLRAARYS